VGRLGDGAGQRAVRRRPLAGGHRAGQAVIGRQGVGPRAGERAGGRRGGLRRSDGGRQFAVVERDRVGALADLLLATDPRSVDGCHPVGVRIRSVVT